MSSVFSRKKYIIKGEGEPPIPHDCPICRLSLRDISDVISYETWECCTDCQNNFVYRDREAWRQGKRPTQEEIDDFRENLRGRPSYLIS